MREKRRKHKQVAAAVSVSAAVGVFAVLGSAGLAQTALAPAQELVGQNQPVEQDQPADKVEICHKGRNTSSISANALPAHLRHEDTENACTVAVPTAGTASVTKPKKPPKAESTGSTEPSATEKTKFTKTSPARGQKTAKPAWGKSKTRTGADPELSVAVEVKKAKKATKPARSERGFVAPLGLGGAPPPGHASGKGNRKSK